MEPSHGDEKHKKTQRDPAAPLPTLPPSTPADLDIAKLDLSVEKVDERISPSETNVFDK